MFLIAWSTPNQGINLWQMVDGEDAVQVFVHELDEGGVLPEDVLVFRLEQAL